MQTKHGFFQENTSIQDEHRPLVPVNNSFDGKQFLKSFLEQAKSTALGGAVLVNSIILVQTLMGHKFTIEDHKRLETVLLSYWGLRGSAAGIMALTGLANKAPDAIAAINLTERNIIKMLAIFGFLRKMPFGFSINSALQIAFSVMVVMDHGLSAKALVQDEVDPSGFSYPEIKNRYQGQTLLIVLLTLKEMLFRATQMMATTHTAASAITDDFIDSISPVDPPNQEQIWIILALAFAIIQVLCVLHPVSSQVAQQVRSLEINIGLVFLPLVSLVFDYLPDWFSAHSLETGLIALLLVAVIPAILEAMVNIWSYQDKQKAEVKPQDEIIVADLEDVIEEKREYTL